VPPSPDELAAMLEQARQEGRDEFNRTRDRKESEDQESLAGYLLRELKEAEREGQEERQAEQSMPATSSFEPSQTPPPVPGSTAGSYLSAAYSGPKARP
jgi:hypothetical protein